MEEGSSEQALKDGRELPRQEKKKKKKKRGEEGDILSRIKAQMGKYLEVKKSMEDAETRNWSKVDMRAQAYYRENN